MDSYSSGRVLKSIKKFHNDFPSAMINANTVLTTSGPTTVTGSSLTPVWDTFDICRNPKVSKSKLV